MDQEGRSNEKAAQSEASKREEAILRFWEENKIFEKSLEKPAPSGDFVFYEGPPTANGKPGIHHLVARAFKDIIPRYKTMQGFHVRRKGGWDTHGLPVELQVEKQLGLKSKKEVEGYGVEKFNKKCKESVWEYVDLWEKFTRRIGYWVDQKNPYVTYENYYIEAVWNILKTVNDKGLLYKDYKVVPWCPRCGTALSSHELAQGYEEVKDLSVTVKFHLKPGQKFGDYETKDSAYVLAWTTTPWTLPGNVALAVGEKINYTALRVKGVSELLIVATDRVMEVFKDQEIEVVHENIPGKDLVGLKYEPLFPFLKEKFEDKDPAAFTRAYQIYAGSFVNTEDGTGVVHTAVMYGQDDFELGTKIGLPKFHLVAPDGAFVSGTGFLAGRFVKEVDEKGKPTLAVDVIEDLKKRNLFFSQENIKHTYPFCWRCKTALIYYARDSWYIKMSSLREKLVAENEHVNWTPSYIKEGRFGEWLREIKDWAISRERFWGTPLPVWQKESGEVVVVGSINELKEKIKKSGNKYFTLRHGEAEQNIQDIINSDPKNIYHLTDVGKQQVESVANGIKSKNIDLIITSPFARCQETAEMVRKNISLPEEAVIVDERLGEFKKGSNFEGKNWEDYWKLFNNTKERFEKSPDGGENLWDLHRRAGDFVYDIESKHSNKNILIVSHEGPIAALHTVAQGANFDQVVSLKENQTYKSNFAQLLDLNFVPLPHNENYELDLHKPYIDEIKLVDEDGNKLTRVKEVMDVWFDSGAMPFAQDGLVGFENIKYPADYIAEAIDQTRGWFYTLHAIGVLMDKGRAYRNVVCLGHILDANGKKMSKSVGNIIDPWLMIEKYGVDALRLWMYTVNQPGDSKNFDEKTVDELVKKVFNPIENILSFYKMYKVTGDEMEIESQNVLDRWIISLLNKLLSDGEKQLDNYQIFEAGRSIRDFVNDFSTWYIRRSRERFKSDNMSERVVALSTTRIVLLHFAKYLAPFAPFFAEYLYSEVRRDGDPESVHLANWPKAGEVDDEVLQKMAEVRRVVSLALEKRMSAGLKVRQPLQQLKVKSSKLKVADQNYLDLIKDEINVKEIEFDQNINEEVWLDTNITPALQNEGNVREFIRSIQDIRKEKQLSPTDLIDLWVDTDEAGRVFLEESDALIKKPTNISKIFFQENDGQEIQIQDLKFKIFIKTA